MCDHQQYNELCAICHHIEDEAAYAFKEGYLDNADTWEEKLEYYNRPEPTDDRDYEAEEIDRQVEVATGN